MSRLRAIAARRATLQRESDVLRMQVAAEALRARAAWLQVRSTWSGWQAAARTGEWRWLLPAALAAWRLLRRRGGGSAPDAGARRDGSRPDAR